MKLVRWDHLQELVAMSNRLNRTLEDPYTPRTEDAFGTWAPPVDIFETHDRVILRAEIPGVQKEDMDVRIENGVLSLQGDRKQEAEIREDTAHRVERIYGAFTRSFTLPSKVDPEKTSAVLRHGVLTLTLNKVAEAQPKQIAVTAR